MRIALLLRMAAEGRPGSQEKTEFENKYKFDKVPYLLGEIPQGAITTARFLLPQEKVKQ